MSNLRWMGLAILLGCFAFLAQPGRANAAVHHARPGAAPRAALHQTHRGIPTSAPRPTRHSPTRNASRVANHARTHSGKSKQRQHVSSHATPAATGFDDSLTRSRLALALAVEHDLDMNRTLESRGPPRASPEFVLALPGLYPPPTRAPLQLRFVLRTPRIDLESQPQPMFTCLDRPRTSFASPIGSSHAVRPEGAAACHESPSSGGVSV